jgi:ATP-binding cassette subfamily B protein
MRERIAALRNVVPFSKLIWQTSPALTLATLGLRLIRALLPVATLYVGKLIIDQVVVLVQARSVPATLSDALASGQLTRLLTLLAIELGLAVLSDLLGRATGLLDSMLGELFTNNTSVRLMEHAATLDLAGFEDSDLQDKLERARRQTAGSTWLLGQLAGQIQDVITLASFAAGLVIFAPC